MSATPKEGERADQILWAELRGSAGGRLDKALAAAAPQLSRARLQALMREGRVTRGGEPANDPSAPARPGRYSILLPAPAPAAPKGEDIPLSILFEDEHLIVLDKAAGMSAHPAPGSPAGTLVNALIRHCGEGLSGIGGVARPGIVHRLDKLTSGVMAAAKTDVAHRGLAAQFAAHSIERVYAAFTRGAPKARSGSLAARIGRSRVNRKKMAILGEGAHGGRMAVTHWRTLRLYGPAEKPLAARLALTLETGRTHQIRVHLAHLGSPCLGDPVYGSAPPAPAVRAAVLEAGLARQALHAEVLGFTHPVTGEALRFQSDLPEDMARLAARLADAL
ncbi:MAG: RluA family pseudouridine synthase [Caulobacteraceae bacterium]